jgi:hypothetical protein
MVVSVRSRWEEWVIRGSIILLIGIGVGAIWGKPIRDWLGSLGGTSEDTSGAEQPHASPGGTL